MIQTVSLSSLAPGQRGTVVELPGGSSLRRRLEDLGLVPGTEVACVGRSPLGDPSAFFFRGTVVALRRADAGNVRVRP